MIKRAQTCVQNYIHSISNHHQHNPHHQKCKNNLLKLHHNKRLLSASTLLNHRHLNRSYSLNLQANTLFSRLREDASKSQLVALSFKDMVEYSRSAQLFNESSQTTTSRSNTNNLTTKLNETHSIESAEYVRKQLGIIIARIIIDFQNLPYGVADNSRIEQIMQTYIDSYTAIKQIPKIKNLSTKQQFHEILDKYLATWTQASVG